MARARKCAQRNAGKMPALRERTLGAQINFSSRVASALPDGTVHSLKAVLLGADGTKTRM
ncbi:MAG: hypothetical protein WAM96_04585 [Candidatus Acidiferrales bacterium]